MVELIPDILDVKVHKALMHLVIHKPFYGALILRLKVSRDRSGHPTAWTDGSVLRYNAEWMAKKSFDDIVTILAHEVTHCALAHPYRMKGRDSATFQQAGDYVVNSILVGDGDFKKPDNDAWLYDKRFDGMSVEQVYTVLRSEQQTNQEKEDDGERKDGDGQSSSESTSSGGEGKGSSGDTGDKPDVNEGSDGGSSPGESGSSDDGDEDSGDASKQPEKEDGGDTGEADRTGDEDETDNNNEQDFDGELPSSDGGEHGGKTSEQEIDLSKAPGTEYGDVLEAGTSGERGAMGEAERVEAQEEWENATAVAAMQAGAAGDLPGRLKRALEESYGVLMSDEEQIRMFIQSTCKEGADWSRPSRRTLSQGLYLPTQFSEAAGKFVVAVDTSGSVSKWQLGHFESILKRIHEELRPEEVIMLYCDWNIQGEQRIGRYDDVEFDREQVLGGGGTRFTPAFRWIDEHHDEGIEGIIYLTDLEAPFPTGDEEWWDPDLKKLWVSVNAYAEAPAHCGPTCYLQRAD